MVVRFCLLIIAMLYPLPIGAQCLLKELTNPLTEVATAVMVSAPANVAKIAMVTISINKWSGFRWVRGSSICLLSSNSLLLTCFIPVADDGVDDGANPFAIEINQAPIDWTTLL